MADQYVVLLKASIEVREVLQCLHEQQSADEQDQRKCDLGHHQSTAESEALTGGRQSAPVCLHRLAWRCVRRLDRWCETKQQAREYGQPTCESKYTPISAQVEEQSNALCAEEGNQEPAEALCQYRA